MNSSVFFDNCSLLCLSFVQLYFQTYFSGSLNTFRFLLWAVFSLHISPCSVFMYELASCECNCARLPLRKYTPTCTTQIVMLLIHPVRQTLTCRLCNNNNTRWTRQELTQTETVYLWQHWVYTFIWDILSILSPFSSSGAVMPPKSCFLSNQRVRIWVTIVCSYSNLRCKPTQHNRKYGFILLMLSSDPHPQIRWYTL